MGAAAGFGFFSFWESACSILGRVLQSGGPLRFEGHCAGQKPRVTATADQTMRKAFRRTEGLCGLMGQDVSAETCAFVLHLVLLQFLQPQAQAVLCSCYNAHSTSRQLQHCLQWQIWLG